MLKRSIIIVLLMLISVPGLPGKPEEEEFRGRKIPQLPFYIFTYREHKSYYILSGYMGDVRDLKIMKIKEKQSGKRCMKVIYKPEFNMQRSGWSGLYWQYPANNWGNSPKGGYDLSGANFLYFYARGTKGEEAIEFKIGGIQGSYGDSDDITTGLILLTKKWTLYKIDLRERNLKNIIGGFGIIMASHYHPEGLSFFLNDVYYTKEENPDRSFFKDYARKVSVEKSLSVEETKSETVINISEPDTEFFSSGKFELKKSGDKILDKVTQIIKKENFRRVIITLRMYDDSRDEYNKALSLKRAESVRQYFIKEGIDKKKLGFKRYELEPSIQKKKKMLFAQGEKFKILIIKWKEGTEDTFKEFYFSGMDAYIRKGYAIAIEKWEKALKMDPENDEIRERIKEAQEKMKEDDK